MRRATSSRRRGDRNSSSRPPESAGRSSSRTMAVGGGDAADGLGLASTSSAPSAPGVAVQAGLGQRLVQRGRCPARGRSRPRPPAARAWRRRRRSCRGRSRRAGRRPPRPRAAGARRAGRCRRGRRSRAAARASRRCPRGRGRWRARRGSGPAGRRAARGRCRGAGACRASTCRRACVAACLRARRVEQLVDPRAAARRATCAETASTSRPVRPACRADASSRTPTRSPGLSRLR